MKSLPLKTMFTAATLFLLAISCSKKETSESANETETVLQTKGDSLVNEDAAVLRDDSATVKTAMGVEDEEQNAIKQEKKEAEKLEQDKMKDK